MRVAPSPDWFTSVPSLARKRDGRWLESETVKFDAQDSGANSTTTYKAEKIAVNPFVPTTLYDAPMFLQIGGVPVVTATIR